MPAIAWKSTQEEPKKPKRKGFLELFGKKKEAPPTSTTTMLYTLNRDMIARQQSQSRRLSEHADSLAARNSGLNRQLQRLIRQVDAKVQDDFQKRYACSRFHNQKSNNEGCTSVSFFAVVVGLWRFCNLRSSSSWY